MLHLFTDTAVNQLYFHILTYFSHTLLHTINRGKYRYRSTELVITLQQLLTCYPVINDRCQRLLPVFVTLKGIGGISADKLRMPKSAAYSAAE